LAAEPGNDFPAIVYIEVPVSGASITAGQLLSDHLSNGLFENPITQG